MATADAHLPTAGIPFLYTVPNPIHKSSVVNTQYELQASHYLSYHGFRIFQEFDYFFLSDKRSSLRELLMQYHFHIEDDVPVEFPLDYPPFRILLKNRT